MPSTRWPSQLAFAGKHSGPKNNRKNNRTGFEGARTRGGVRRRGGGRGFMTVARERARKNRRRGSQVTGLNSRPRPSSPSCGVDRPYRKPGTNPREFKSQGGEDAFLNRHFNSTRVGTYLDIGCNDGVDGSNTFYFQQRGWQGVCVEADPAKFLQILPHSSRRDGVNLAIANRSSCLTFARVHDSNNGLSGIASTLDVERCADTCAPGPPYCTYGLRVPAFCVPYVPEARSSLPARRHTLYVTSSLRRAARNNRSSGRESLVSRGST